MSGASGSCCGIEKLVRFEILTFAVITTALVAGKDRKLGWKIEALC